MGTGKNAKMRVQKYKIKRAKKMKDARAAKKAPEPKIGGGDDGSTKAEPKNNSDQINAADEDVKMVDDVAVGTNDAAVAADAGDSIAHVENDNEVDAALPKFNKLKNHKNVQDITDVGRRLFQGKKPAYIRTKFLKDLAVAMPVGLRSTCKDLPVSKLWESDYVKRLDNALRFTGRRGQDAARILAFFTKVLEVALKLKTDNPSWFPKTDQQVMMLDDAREYLHKIFESFVLSRLDAGGLAHARRPSRFLICETIDKIAQDRLEFLEICRSDADFRLNAEKLPTTRKQNDLLAAIDAWRASIPDGKKSVGDYVLSALDPSESKSFDLAVRLR